MLDRTAGSVHQEVALRELAPGDGVERHLHSFEQAVYILAGRLTVAGEVLAPDDWCFVDVGVAHDLRNDGEVPARFLEVGAPQPGATLQRDGAGEIVRGRFEPGDLAAFGGDEVTGGSMAMLIDAPLASQLRLFVVEFRPGGGILEHDHPFEECYVVVEGEVEATVGGARRTLGPGGWAWSAVGVPHSFANRGERPVRWLETQAPQPPARHHVRFTHHWRS